jgi:hypothetical protein
VLTERGPREYSCEQCLHDYRFNMLDQLHFPGDGPRPPRFFSANEAAWKVRDMAIERVGAAILDHNAGGLLPE